MFKDWKTTLFGLGAGALNMFASGTDWKHVLVSVAMAGMGWFAKDAGALVGSPKQ